MTEVLHFTLRVDDFRCYSDLTPLTVSSHECSGILTLDMVDVFGTLTPTSDFPQPSS